jgi:hypothetical protein
MNNRQTSERGYIGVVTLILILVLFGYIGWSITPNLKGYCKKENRYLTDEEKIDSAIEYILSGYPGVVDILEKQGEDIVRVDVNIPKKPIYYNSIEEFKTINKDCCRLFDFGINGDQAGFITRANGGLSTYVRVRYKVRYYNGDNELIEDMKEILVAVTNCGRGWQGW